MASASVLKKLVESETQLVSIETDDIRRISDILWKLSMSMGWALYNWSQTNGLYRIGMDHIFIPRTDTPAGMLNYILRSNHFGIYLLQNFNQHINNPNIQKMIYSIAEKDDGIRRLLVLLDEKAVIPTTLEEYILRIKHKKPSSNKNAGFG